MSGKPVCLVAGVGPGIGMAVAKRFAREGFALALVARRQVELDVFAAEIAAAGGSATAYVADLTDPDAIAATVARVATELGAVTVLVYNAGVWREADPMALPSETFTKDLTLCATGALAAAQAVYPAMKAAGAGSMLFTGGGLALHPEYGSRVISLVAGKSALRGLVLALAPVMAESGIHAATVTVVGTVAPGTAFDPDAIADRFWAVHAQARSDWTAESVFDGAA